MPAAYLNDDGEWVKECLTCKEVLPVSAYRLAPPSRKGPDRYRTHCHECYLAKVREDNAKRAKKRRQQSHKLEKRHIEWIKEQQGKLSTRKAAKEFSKRFFNMKINHSTVSRIYAGILHGDPVEREDTVSIYDLLEGASEYTGSVEEYLESNNDKKVKF
jgi:hypothetical protein